uniref:PH domain-containing protein n=1 Tax=Cryptomonas curvata TaxID=233186 RepID=A0A7S0QI89_9CRYP|mmetsp:Transcript_25886/g.53813  ORF Transcript_25886/g.53813 Transcript_25886/m.53813 type:complete len:140 (+) Transcript_25886:33-452(+)
MGCCSSRAPGQHEWQSQVPGSFKANPIPTVNKRADIPADFFSKCIKKGWLKTLPKKQKIWCMIHENNFYFMDNEADTEPRKFFSFDGCIIKMDKNMLEIETKELMNGSVPRATYKFLADDANTAMDWYEAALKASSRRN